MTANRKKSQSDRMWWVMMIVLIIGICAGLAWLSVDPEERRAAAAAEAVHEEAKEGIALDAARVKARRAAMRESIRTKVEREIAAVGAGSAMPLNARMVRQGPEHVTISRYGPATIERSAGDGEMSGRGAFVTIEPEGGGSRIIGLPDDCDPTRARTMTGRSIVVHTEHWRWTGGGNVPKGRIVHTIDRPAVIAAVCGAGDRAPSR